MTESDDNSVEVLSAGGVRIEIRKSEVIAYKDRKAFERNEKKRRWIALLWFAFNLYVSFSILEFPRPLSSIRQLPKALTSWPIDELSIRLIVSLLVWLFIAISFVFALRIMMLQIRKRLRFTPDVIEIIETHRGRLHRTQSYLKADVTTLHYEEEMSIFPGTKGRLCFTVGDQQIKCLYPLKCLEANRILSELQRMGFDVLRDAGLPMMIEMEQARRKRPFALFP
jgi:hypothetical protein